MLRELGVGALVGTSGGFVTGTLLYYVGATVNSFVPGTPTGTAGFVIGFAGTLTAGLGIAAAKILKTE